MSTYTLYLDAGVQYGVMVTGDEYLVVRATPGDIGLTIEPVERALDFTDALDRAASLNL